MSFVRWSFGVDRKIDIGILLWQIFKISVKINRVHSCRDAAFGLSHDTFFYSVGLAVHS